MQVRPIEFQESFARAPVEQARQQHVLQREPDLARDQSARLLAESHLLDLGRSVQTTQTEGALVQPDQQHPFDQRLKRRRKEGDVEKAKPKKPPIKLQGQNIDIIA